MIFVTISVFSICISNISGSLTAHSVNNQSYAMELERLRDQSNEISQLKKENEELRETIHKLKVLRLPFWFTP